MNYAFLEAAATVCNITANAFVLKAMCRSVNAAIPDATLVLQIVANMFWILFAMLTCDVYLTLTATISLTMQCVSIFIKKEVLHHYKWSEWTRVSLTLAKKVPTDRSSRRESQPDQG